MNLFFIILIFLDFYGIDWPENPNFQLDKFLLAFVSISGQIVFLTYFWYAESIPGVCPALSFMYHFKNLNLKFHLIFHKISSVEDFNSKWAYVFL